MTPIEWIQKAAGTWGNWDDKLPESKRAVWEYLKSKSGRYLNALYAVLVERRPPRYGAPSLPDLREVHEEAAQRMEILPVEQVVPQITDGEEIVSPEEWAREWSAIQEKLKAKEVSRRVAKQVRKS